MSSGVMSSHAVYVKWLVTLLLSAGVMLVPAGGGFDEELRLFSAITVFYICTIVFEFLNVIVPSVLLTAVYVLSGLAPVEVALQPWTSPLVYMIVGAYALVNVMDECGLLKRVSIWCILRCGGTYNGALYGMFLTGLVLGIITFNNAYLIMVSFAYGVTKSFGYDRPCREAALMMFVGAVSAHACASAVYNPLFVGLAESGLRLVQEGYSIPWYEQTVAVWPTLLFNVFFIWLLTRLYKTKNYTTSNNSRAYFEEQARALGPMSVKEKKCCIVLALLMLYLFLSPLHGMPAVYGFMVLPWLLFLPGFRVGGHEAIGRISFPILVFIVSCMSIAAVGGHLGLNQLVSSAIVPMLSDLSDVSVVMGALLAGTLANVVMTPGAMLPTLCAPFAGIAVSLGIKPLALIMTLIVTCDVYIFPHEIACFMILIGFGLISISEFVKLAALKTVLFFIFYAVVQIPYWNVIGYIR